MRLTVVMAALIAGCATEEAQLDSVEIRGELPAQVDHEQVTLDFLASGAQFGLVVDPATGDIASLVNTDRVVNSADFTQLAVNCDDCGGVNSTCTGPAGMQRQITIALQRNAGSSDVDVAYSGNNNWTPIGQDCDGAPCPAIDVDATGGAVPFEVTLFGALTTCTSFSVFFDTDG